MIASLVSLVVLLLLSLGAHLPAVRQYVLKYGSDYLRASQNVDLEAASFEYNLFALSTTLRDVRLRSQTARDLPPLLTADRVYLSLRLRDLVRGQFTIQEARLEGLVFRVVVDEQGRSNVPGSEQETPTAESPAGSRFPFLIETLSAGGSQITFENRRRRIRLRLPPWRLTVRGNRANQEHSIGFNADRDGSLAVEGHELPVRGVNVELGLTATDLMLRSAQFRLGNSEVSVRGRLADLAQPRFDLALSAGLDLGELAPLAGVRDKTQGRLELQATVRETLDHLQVEGEVKGEDIGFEEFRKIRLAAKPAWEAGTKRLRIEDLSLRSPTGLIQGRADLDLAAQAGESMLQLRFQDLDLQPLTRQMKMPFQAATRATGEMDFRWEGFDYKNPAGIARARLAAVRGSRGKGSLPINGSLTATARRSRWALSVASLQAAGAEVHGDLVLESFSQISGTARGKAESLARTVSAVNAFLGKPAGESIAPTDLDGSAEVVAHVAGTLESPEVVMEAHGRQLRIAQVEGAELRADATYRNARLSFAPLRMDWRGQSFSARGDVAFEGEKPRLDLQVEAKQSSLGAILAGLGAGLPVEGLVDLSAQIRGTPDEPEGTLVVSARDVTAYGELLGRLQVDTQLANRRVEVSRLVLEKPREQGPSGYLRAAATYDIPTGQYSAQAQGERLEFQSLSLPGEIPVRGTLELSAKGEGTRANPSLEFRIQASDPWIAGAPLGPVQLSGQLHEQVASWTIDAPHLNLAGSGQIHTTAPYPAEFQVTANRTDLSFLKIAGPAETPVGGVVTGSVQASGELGDWAASSLVARISELRLAIRGQEIRNEGALEARLEEGTLNVEPSRLVADKSELKLEGSLPVNGSRPAGELTLQARLDPEDLLAFVPPAKKWQAQGDVKIHATLRGSLQRLEPSFQLDIRDGFFSSPQTFVPLSGIEVVARTREGSLFLERATAEWASGQISAQAEVPFGVLARAGFPMQASEEGGPARALVRVEGLKLESTEKLLPEGIGGEVSLQVRAEASELNLDALTATTRFEKFRLNMRDWELAQAEPGSLSLRNGIVSVERFALRGPETRLEITGRASFADPVALDLKAEGQTDIRILNPLQDRFRATGASQVQLAVTGSLSDPRVSGVIELKQGQATLATLPLQAERLDMRLRVSPDQLAIENLTGTLNGGELRASGIVGYTGTEIKDVRADLTARDLFLNFPEGLGTASEADIRVRTQGDQIVVGGELRILEGSFREPLEMESEVLAFLRSGRSIAAPAERDPFLSRVQYNLPIRTVSPIVVDNNMGKLAATLDLRLVGTYYHPSLTGRLSLGEGGELYIAEKTYVIDTGRVDFVNEARIEPAVNVVARTRAGGYDIELRMAGGTENLETTLTSDPPLPEPDIISVLLTGRTLEEARGAGVNVAKEQALSYLTGRVGGRLSRQAQKTLGLSQVRIEPNLIAAESDPSVRLTIGQELRRDLRLIYSMNLANSGDQIYVAEYDFKKRFNTRAVKQSDNSYRLGFNHDLQFGGAGPPSAQRTLPETKFGKITLTGNPVFSEKELTGKLGVSSGKSYDFITLRKGINRLQAHYRKQGYLESRVSLHQSKRPATVDVEVEVEAGPQIEFVYDGADVPGKVRSQVRRDWQEGVFDAQRGQDAVKTIEEWLIRSDYLQPSVTYRVETASPDRKRVRFRIEPGVRYEHARIAFDGAAGLSPERLEEVLKRQDALADVYLEPRKVVSLLTNFYQLQGYLDANIERPRYEMQPEARTARAVVAVREGPLYRIGRILFQGNRAMADRELQAAIPLNVGQTYDAEALEASVDRLEELYWARGYNDVVIHFASARNSASAELDVTFQITEYKRGVIEGIELEGNDAVSEAFIRKRIELSEGEVFDFEKADRSRKNLYQTGAFTLVDFETESRTGPSSDLPIKPLRIHARVREVRPHRLRYGGFFDTDRGPGAILDYENRNTLGSARLAGVRTRYDSELREIRGFFGQPLTWGTPTTLNFTGFRRREIVPREFTSDFITDRTGFSVQQELALKNGMIFNYGYRFERTHTFDREPDPNCPLPPDDPFCRFDEAFKVAPLTSSFTWATRDDPLDATQGFFTSHAVEFAPAILGSDLRFLKYFGQFIQYVPLSKAAQVPFRTDQKKPRFIYAGGVRVGLGRGFGGQGLILNERFFAGGGTTIRGFDLNRVGPLDFLGDPAGGEAVFVANNELRFPLISFLEGVGFLDLGNVYPKASDFNPFEVRKSAGAGLRVRTPYFLLRLDYGMKLDRKPGESRGKFFFSIGQAF